jgi:hypothetical protein
MLEDGQGGIEAVTVAYGLGMRALLDGDRPSAVTWFDRAVSGQAWAAFGYLAAEAELARPEILTGSRERADIDFLGSLNGKVR